LHLDRARLRIEDRQLLLGGTSLMPDEYDDATLPAAGTGGVSGTEATVAPDESAGRSAGTIAPGRGDDYGELVPVDPRHYVVGAEIARGGMGRILAARDRRLGRSVAIKELVLRSGDARARFEREARITARLQHPAIVNIHEAGAWPSGEPFFAMKLVTGEALDRAIAKRSTLSERLELLPNVIAVVDALAYAHSLRVIHRDLKPANVLVGEFGETVVIDWGLAKDLADTNGAADQSAGPARDEAPADQTVAGAVMGTPSYMPAEQAIGDPVDERADVYALGAILYHLLAGAPPYTGKTVDEVLARVISGPPPPLAERVSGIPLDLITIVEKAMSHDADRRYPTAKGLSDDLKRFQTGQLVGSHRYSMSQLVRRWLRRHRAAVAVAGVALAVLLVLGAVALQRIVRSQHLAEEQRGVAEDQRALAQQSRGDAEELLGFMLGDLRKKLQPLGRLDLLDDVAQKAVAYYDRRAADLSDVERLKRARAWRNLGDVLLDQGDAAGALHVFQRSLAIVEPLAAADPTNADRQGDLSTSLGRVGNVLLGQNDAADALVQFRRALAIDEAQVARHPTDAMARQVLAGSHDDIGNADVALGDTKGALTEYRISKTLREALAAEDPADSARQNDLVSSQEEIGDALREEGDSAAGLDAYQVALVTTSKLAAADPSDTILQRDLSIVHGRIGDVRLERGDTAAALSEFQAGMTIDLTLTELDPTNADWQQILAQAHDSLGRTLKTQGDSAGALQEFRAELAITERLLARNPANATRQRDVSLAQEKIGNVLQARGDVKEALVAFRASLSLRETLANKDPTNIKRQRDLGYAHMKIGNVLLEQQDAAGAEVEQQAFLQIAMKAAAKDPTNIEMQWLLGLAHEMMGNVRHAQGDLPAALTEYRAEMDISQTLAARDPANAERARGVQVVHYKIGNVLFEKGDAAAALTEYRGCLAIAEAHATQDPNDVQAQADVAVCHQQVGNALLAMSDKSGALAEYQAGLAIARRAQEKDPTNADWRGIAAGLADKAAKCCGKRSGR
jgi:tetratricopeptide (TPR) repeat protein